ncbi:transferase hexapeptide (six repeat-containing protein) [Paenisporosarcina quisquiliarum]|nr:transferase hexapeptide (six repeat-containing protein) [Paenisporosarcina quisquiliarum]
MDNLTMQFNVIGDERGSLISLEAGKNIPFEIKRVYYIYGVDPNLPRGFHAHKELQQVLVCISGSCRVVLDNGQTRKEYILDKPEKGLIVGNMIWREMHDFSEDCILMVLANNYYDEQDYLRNYEEFLKDVNSMHLVTQNKYFKHDKAIVESNEIGNNTTIWAFSHVLSGAKIGDNCNLNDHTFIENDVIIGNNVTIKSGVHIWDGVTIEDDVFIGPSVVFTNDLNPRSKRYPTEFAKTVIRKFASIGANTTIVAGNTIGEYAMVGAGSVVTKDVPAYSLWYGNPAEFKGYVCECGNKLTKDLLCESCNKRYDTIIGEK